MHRVKNVKKITNVTYKASDAWELPRNMWRFHRHYLLFPSK